MKSVLRIGITFLLSVVFCVCFGAAAFAEDSQTYKITLHANGGYFNNDPNTVTIEYLTSNGRIFYGGTNQPTNPDLHMAFTGWYYDAKCTKLAVSRDNYFRPDRDLTLYAGWTEGWIVTFDANDGQFSSGSSTLLYSVPKGSTLSYSPYVKSADPAYEKDYWMLTDGTQIKVSEYVPERDITLFAHFIRVYQITLNANGGFFSSSSSSTSSSSSALITAHIREGSTFYGETYQPTNADPNIAFTGWYYDKECTQFAVSRNGSYTPDCDLTLYAGWADGWIVTFDANGGKFGYDGSTLRYNTVPKGEPLSYIPSVTSANSNQVLDYWALEDGTRIEMWEYVPSGDVILYAHYSRFYNVVFNANGGYFEGERETLRDRVAENSSIYADCYSPTNSNPHMLFNGWYFDAACTRLAAARDGYFTPESDITLYAGWSQGYILAYDANGGIGRPDKQTKMPGETLMVSWNAPKREGFYFLGWAETPDADRAAYLPGESFTEDADTTLYALWGNPDFILPDSLTEIGEEAFADAAGSFVKLPDSTASVGPRAFAGCTELRYIVIPDYLNQIDFSAFEGTENVIVVTFSQFGRLYRLPDYMRMMAP